MSEDTACAVQSGAKAVADAIADAGIGETIADTIADTIATITQEAKRTRRALVWSSVYSAVRATGDRASAIEAARLAYDDWCSYSADLHAAGRST